MTGIPCFYLREKQRDSSLNLFAARFSISLSTIKCLRYHYPLYLSGKAGKAVEQ